MLHSNLHNVSMLYKAKSWLVQLSWMGRQPILEVLELLSQELPHMKMQGDTSVQNGACQVNECQEARHPLRERLNQVRTMRLHDTLHCRSTSMQDEVLKR